MDVSGNLDGHLGEGTRVKGTLRFEGSVRIDGRFSGKILSPATLILGPNAEVEGEVRVAELAVHGTLRGQVEAGKRVTIHDQGRVEAEIKTDSLVIEPGAFFQGRCDMEREKETPKAAAGVKQDESENTTPSGDGEEAPRREGTGSGEAQEKQSNLLNKKNL